MKKNILFLTLVLSLLSLTGKAGSVAIDWLKIYTGTGTSIATDAAENVYTTTANSSIFLVKRDKFGNFLWERNFTTNVLFNYETPWRVLTDSKGNVIVVSDRHTTSIENGNRINALLVLKYNTSGSLLWQQVITGYFSAFYTERYHNNVSGALDENDNIYAAAGGNVTSGLAGFNTIKITPSGSIAWVRTQSFAQSSFYLVNNIRIKQNLVGLAGFNKLTGPTSLIWLLDTAGAGKWNKANEGYSGQDISYDNLNNVYLLSSVFNGAGANTASDVSVYKFTVAGAQVWLHSFDFGGYEGVLRIEHSAPDNNFVIVANGNQYLVGGSLYTDWLTIKIDTGGNLLWSQRYDKHTNNDESASMIKINTRGDIYVTGIGGPFPGGSNLGKRQWVTVKYLSNGNIDWFIPIDTLSEYAAGVDIALARDGTLFVAGNVSSTVIHLFDFRGQGACGLPTGITASAITNDKATVSWNAVAGAGLYHLRYKTSTAATWITVSTDQRSYTIQGLSPGTVYDYSVEAVCRTGLSGYSSTKQFTTTGSGYCASLGLNSANDWIDLVYVNTLLNSTGNDGGYEDYTHLSTDLQAGATYDMTLSAEIINGPYTETWAVWIDYNQDGDLNDAGEEEVRYRSQQIGWETHSFTVPANALPGPTRMRVSLKRNTAQAPCDTFARGEVEDYTINIINSAVAAVALPGLTHKNIILVTPNPASGFVRVNMPAIKEQQVITIYTMQGVAVKTLRAAPADTYVIDVSGLASGMYMLRATGTSGHSYAASFLKQ